MVTIRDVTIRDVAERCGVSVSTVSDALNNPSRSRIGMKTRERVLGIAKELEYHPNSSARALVTKKTGNIGFVLAHTIRHHAASVFYSEILFGAEAEIKNFGYHVIFSRIDEEFQAKKDLPTKVKERKVDGLLLVGNVERSLISALRERGLPLVLVDSYVKGEKVDCVVTDNVNGAREAVNYLINLGHREIGFIGGPLSNPSALERFEGYKSTLREYELDYNEEFVKEGNLNFEGGYFTMQEILELPSLPTAIFCVNDITAVGAMKAIGEKGLEIPKDVSLMGFDDIEMASQVYPGLTTLRVFKQEMGKMAAKKLIEHMNNPKKRPDRTVMLTELVIRESCRSLNRSNYNVNDVII